MTVARTQKKWLRARKKPVARTQKNGCAHARAIARMHERLRARKDDCMHAVMYMRTQGWLRTHEKVIKDVKYHWFRVDSSIVSFVDVF